MADLQDIVDDLEAEIRRPISVEDRRWRLLAHSAQPDEADPVRRSSILTRETSPDVVAWLEGLGLQRARDLVDIPRNDALGMTRRGCLPIRHGDVLLGFLWVIVGDRPLTDAERAALVRGGGEVAANLWARHRAADERFRRTQELLRALLAGEDASADLAATLRWQPSGTFAVAVVEGDEEVAERLRRRRAAGDVAWLARDDDLVVLVRDPPPALSESASRRGRRGAPTAAGPATPAAPGAHAGAPERAGARRSAGYDLAGPAVLLPTRGPSLAGLVAALVAAGATGGGASAPFGALTAAPRALRQAEVAAVCARARAGSGPIAAWDELGSWALIAELWLAADHRPLPPQEILALAAHRRGDQLIEALEALLEAGGDVAAAAKALHLHRASLYRRLERVEEITGLDLERGDDRLLAHLGLRLYRLTQT